MGKIDSNRSFYIKGHHYKLDEILGDPDKAANYQDGYFYIFYLSPSHYHRIHYPIDGRLLTRYALGGKSYPVNQLGMRFGDQPFATNFRIISELNTDFGSMAMIKVGALNINSITLSHASDHFKKGEELGFFSFGSTVIILLEKSNAFQNMSNADMEVTMGQTIGKWTL
ncbi:phosphatidylserine decarboxylase [Virgibacillus halophilus]|uniref:Phosphatidylserine decarboxylase n=2 Tax=Tigheibacillus halophilus TaxID=361280 RepID=A0ABU5C7P4_9BACI|nr:phosphatidylserine decarboxylase [Virgibacillus halophilus]